MSFASDVTKWCTKTAPDEIDRVVRTCTIEIGTRAVMRSPVGDASYWKSPAPPGYAGGRFRGNWQYGYNSKPSSDLARIDASGSATIGAIIGSAKSGGISYIVNNLPYAERIENGWSRQAPHGIVTLIEMELPEIFRRASA